MIPYIPVQGTEGWQVDDPDPRHPRNWWRSGSLLVEELAGCGLELVDPDDPFIWSTDLDGAKFWERWPWFRSRKDKRDWLAGGKALRWKCESLGYTCVHPRLRTPRVSHGLPIADPQRKKLVLITHSHGIQVALNAAAEGLVIDVLLDIAGPVRADVLTDTAAGLQHIGRWMHVTDDARDLIQMLGRIGDGHVGPVQLPASVKIVTLPGIDHSALLANPKFVPSAWREHGLLAFLLETEVVRA